MKELVAEADVLGAVMSAADVVDEGAASSEINNVPGVLGIVVAGGPIISVFWGWVDGVVDTSVCVVKGSAVDV